MEVDYSSSNLTLCLDEKSKLLCFWPVFFESFSRYILFSFMCCYFDFKFIGSSHPYSLKCDVKAGKRFLSVNTDEMRSSNKYPRKRTFAFDATYLYSWGDVYSNTIKHTVASPSPSPSPKNF